MPPRNGAPRDAEGESNGLCAQIARRAGSRRDKPSNADPRRVVDVKRVSIEFKVAGGFVGAFLLLLVGGSITYWTSTEFAQSAQLVAHTQVVRTRLGELYAAVSDAESAQRNYLLTGAKDLKDDYAGYVAESRRHAAALEVLLADNPAQEQSLERLNVLMAERLSELEQTTAVRDQRGLDAARAMVATESGALMMDAYREQTREMNGVEGDLLVQREARASRDRRNYLVVLMLTMTGAAAVFAFLLHAIRREMLARAGTDERVRELNTDLQRQVEERGAAVESAEAANRAKSAFLATMSHEIRTPMNGVIGMVEVLSHTHLLEHQADAVRTIRDSAFSLLGIIDDILDFSKIEAGRLELERSPVVVSDLVESVCDSLLPGAFDKEVELSLFVDPNVPERIWSDPTRLRQVLFNLAGNAIKFSAGRPELRGRVSIRVEAENEAKCLVLHVADNGIGMSEETLARMFSSFTQAETSTTRRFGGTGLGLAISKRLITLMKGEISARSVLDVGSTFTVTLPFEAVQGSSGRSSPDLTNVECILVGPDSEVADLRAYLEPAGAQVYPAADLHAAARLATRLDGPVVMRSMRHDRPSAESVDAAFAATPHLHHVLMVRGRQLRLRPAAANVVMLDGNCVRRSALLRAVAVAAGRVSPELADAGDGGDFLAEAAGPTTVAHARIQGRLILIAEDDEINQKVILRQIELLGYAAEVAENGVEALRLWRAGRYGILLTDLHMPDMDGYALCQAIRREEAERGEAWRPRMPILALTANALRGEAVRAEAVGMDDYLTKPLLLNLLKAALGTWLPHDHGETMPAELDLLPDAAAQPVRAVHVAVLEGLVGGDPALIRELLVEYRTSTAGMATELRTAYEAGETRKVADIAHKLKASSRSVGALELGDLCAELENACLTGKQRGIAQSMVRFEDSLLAAHADIDTLLAPLWPQARKARA
jgi:signal transduction histidine kinase/HPt (histidine-containing phosphotransfer) domain-containing protein/ActR/RegA family two-component response regulator